MTFTYPAVFQKHEDGSYTGYFPDLDQCFFKGETIDDAINDAIAEEKEWIEAQVEEDEVEGANMPYVSDREDIVLKENEFIRDVAVIMHFEVGYSD